MLDSWSEWRAYSYIALEKNNVPSAKWLEWLAGQLKWRLIKAIIIAISTLSTLLLLRTFYVQELRMPETVESSLKIIQPNNTINTGYSVKPIAYIFPQ